LSFFDLAADHELERKLSALRSLLLETTPSYTISVVGTPSTNHDADDDSRVEDAEAQIPPVNEGVYHPYLPFGNNNNASDSEEESEDDEYDGEEDENGADPLWLAAAHGDAIGVATLLKQGGTSSINYLLGASNKESAASSSTSPPNAQHLPMPPAAGSTDRNARKRSTPLAAASARGHTAVVQVLLAAAMAELGAGSGAEGSGEALGSSSDDGGGNFAAFVDAPNAQGSTSLLLAAARGWHEVSII
jgi:ankyrin repeat protein